MSNFEIKIIPKDKVELSKFINFKLFKGITFKQFKGKIVYINQLHPDKHIYQACYSDGSESCYPLKYYKGKDDDKWMNPLFTLDELSYEDHIVFCTSEDIKKK